MTIYVLSVYSIANSKLILLDSAKNLKSINYFARNNTAELLDFFIKQACSNNNENFLCVIEDKFKLSILKDGNIYYAIATDMEYSKQMSYAILKKISNKTFNQWNLQEEISINHYTNNPITKITGIQTEILEIQKIMEKNIEDIIKRGENLDDLVKKSDELSESSKIFYNRAKKMNQCCVLL